MSASEKLKALDVAMTEDALRNALPQIVAMVEASEQLCWLTDPRGAIGMGRGNDIRAAAILTRCSIDALEEALP